MPNLALPETFPLPNMATEVSQRDTMFDGRDDHYLSVGLSALGAIEAALGSAPTPRRILDLPCGHGRITRMLRARFPRAAITVCDIDRHGVDFASSRFRARGVHSDGDFRCLGLGRSYDLIWVGSLITHFSELTTRRFLDCMVRHMNLRSTLVLSSHGDFVADRMHSLTYGLAPWDVQGLLREHGRTGYGYRDYPESENYGISVISRRWIEGALTGSPLRLETYVERGWDDHQDVLALRLGERSARQPPTNLLKQYLRGIGAKGRGCARAPAGGVGGEARNGGPRGVSVANAGWLEANYRPQAARQSGGAEMSDKDEPVEVFDEGWYLNPHSPDDGAIRCGFATSQV